MPGIYSMVALTLLGTAILCTTFLNYLTCSDRRYYWLLLAGLPLSFVVNHWIKIPVLTGIAAWTGTPLKLGPDVALWFIVLVLLNSPVFEEAIKVLPLAVPASRVFLKDASSSLYTGLALGMSFGLGEAVYLAYGIAQTAAYNQLPWYAFTGFAVERSIVTFGHGFLTSIVVLGIYSGRQKVLSGYLSAIGLHALINLGPILLALKLIPQIVSSFASYAVILGAFIMFQKNERAAKKTDGNEPVEIIYFERRDID